MSNWISSGMGMGTSGIPTTDNIPETTEIFGCPLLSQVAKRIHCVQGASTASERDFSAPGYL
jgi:hypothetical protein